MTAVRSSEFGVRNSEFGIRNSGYNRFGVVCDRLGNHTDEEKWQGDWKPFWGGKLGVVKTRW
jgi:hypothetical protein